MGVKRTQRIFKAAHNGEKLRKCNDGPLSFHFGLSDSLCPHSKRVHTLAQADSHGLWLCSQWQQWGCCLDVSGLHSMSRPVSFSVPLLSDEICCTATASSQLRLYSMSCRWSVCALLPTLMELLSTVPLYKMQCALACPHGHMRTNQVTWICLYASMQHASGSLRKTSHQSLTLTSMKAWLFFKVELRAHPICPGFNPPWESRHSPSFRKQATSLPWRCTVWVPVAGKMSCCKRQSGKRYSSLCLRCWAAGPEMKL